MTNNEKYIEEVKFIDYEGYSHAEIMDKFTSAFKRLHKTVLVSHLIADEDGSITIPGEVISSRGRRYPALFDINILNNTEPNISIVVEGMGFVNVENYVKYLGIWADEFTPFEYEYAVNHIE